MKRFVLTAAFVLCASNAWADGATTYTIYDYTGSTQIPINANKDASNNFSPSIGGFNSGTAPTVTATPANSSHAAGTSIGGLFSVPIARVNGGSGVITNFNYVSSGGATTSFVLRLWDKNPASTTCTDNTAFASNATDDTHLITQPITISPQPPAATTGDAKTYYGNSGLTWDYKNQDGTPGKNVYVCIVTVSTDTADQNHAVYVTLTGPQN